VLRALELALVAHDDGSRSLADVLARYRSAFLSPLSVPGKSADVRAQLDQSGSCVVRARRLHLTRAQVAIAHALSDKLELNEGEAAALVVASGSAPALSVSDGVARFHAQRHDNLTA
jgi:hypothetical protein